MHYYAGSLEDGANEKRLSRKRRYLTFPEGSTFVVSGISNYNKWINTDCHFAKSLCQSLAVPQPEVYSSAAHILLLPVQVLTRLNC
jgi:hypothetical protein